MHRQSDRQIAADSGVPLIDEEELFRKEAKRVGVEGVEGCGLSGLSGLVVVAPV